MTCFFVGIKVDLFNYLITLIRIISSLISIEWSELIVSTNIRLRVFKKDVKIQSCVALLERGKKELYDHRCKSTKFKLSLLLKKNKSLILCVIPFCGYQYYLVRFFYLFLFLSFSIIIKYLIPLLKLEIPIWYYIYIYIFKENDRMKTQTM